MLMMTMTGEMKTMTDCHQILVKMLKYCRWTSKDNCTDQVIGSDDVAASDNIGVLNGTPG